ncbi:hypothetical protein KL86APRO_11997 [uncultured Alphaproteobacteria bacterium]|jgi:hypothetical protein|uniref:Motility protein n=1 Tax=uncultured Alphaproteobacteria bacterium TaxID=91750 RepID=A0A212K1M3_9PROT|nr:hypothetical protein KL86APRO_11997 [uncultured Alphaproteobacteria bacterium]
MDALTAVYANQAMLQQTLSIAAMKQSAELGQSAVQLLEQASPPATDAPSVPAGSTGQVVDLLA